MPVILINPMNESRPEAATAPPRLKTLAGKTLALLDISKPGGGFFLDRLEELLIERHGVARVIRHTKPAFTKTAPAEVIGQLRGVDAVVEALAD